MLGWCETIELVSKTTILIVDDHTVLRHGLRRILEGDPDLQVIGEAGDGHGAVALAEKLRPAVVLMDRAAFLDSGRTMVPVKFMTEALDMKAEYDVKTGAIYLIRK